MRQLIQSEMKTKNLIKEGINNQYESIQYKVRNKYKYTIFVPLYEIVFQTDIVEKGVYPCGD